MGTTYDPKAPVIGMEARRFRSLLLAWDKRRDLNVIASIDSLGTTPLEVAAVVDEAEGRGYLGFPDDEALDHRFGLAEPGLALAAATNRKRIEAGKAWGILGEVVANAAAANARKDLPFAVEAIWLYGSLAKGKDTVDDIDVVIETRTPEHMTLRQADSIAWRLCHEMGGHSAISRGGVGAYMQATAWVRERVLYGARRNARLSVTGDPTELIGMGVPCRKVFDRSACPDLEASLLHRHPASVGRQNHFLPPRVTPDLAIVPALLPAHCHAAKWLAISDLEDGTDRRQWPGVVCDGEGRIPARLKGFVAECGALDGRGRAVLHDRNADGQGVLVEARLEDGVLHVGVVGRSDGEPIDDDCLQAYLRAVVACTSHRAGMRGLGEVVEAAFINGEEVDVESGYPVGAAMPAL